MSHPLNWYRRRLFPRWYCWWINTVCTNAKKINHLICRITLTDIAIHCQSFHSMVQGTLSSWSRFFLPILVEKRELELCVIEVLINFCRSDLVTFSCVMFWTFSAEPWTLVFSTKLTWQRSRRVLPLRMVQPHRQIESERASPLSNISQQLTKLQPTWERISRLWELV